MFPKESVLQTAIIMDKLQVLFTNDSLLLDISTKEKGSASSV